MMRRNYEDRRTPEYVFDAARISVDKLRQVLKDERLPLTVTNHAGHTLAHIAVKHDNLDVLKYVLSKEPSLLEQKDNYGCSLLHQAVVRGSLNSVKHLVEEHGADICHLDGQYKDRTAVHVAVEFAHLAIVKYFVEDRKVDFNVPNPSQKIPPIFLTAKHRNWDVIEYLVEEKDADMTLLNYNQQNILFPIVRENFMGFMKYLLDEKKFDLDVNWRSHCGETVVHIAATHGRLSILKYLVDEKGAHIGVQKTADRRTPLHYAASQDDVDICEFLIDHGADPRAQDRSGCRAADLARNGRLIRYLEDKVDEKKRRPRSAPSLQFPQEARTTFTMDPGKEDGRLEPVFKAAARSAFELEDILALEKIPLTVTNRDKQSLAHIAAKNDNVEVLKFVLSKQPDLIDARDKFGCTALHQAVVQGSFDSVKYLVEERGADVCYLSGEFNDRTALHAAIEFNQLKILKYFVEERKVDFNEPNPNQRTPPIFLTVKYRKWDIIKYLIEDKKANVRMLDSKKENILFPIVRENFMGFMKYLLDEKKFDIDVDWRNTFGETTVHVAAIRSRKAMLEYLVKEKGAYVNVQKRKDKRTPLHFAASRDDFEICRFLIENGANPYLKDSYGEIPAAKARDRSLFQYLEHAMGARQPRSVPSAQFPMAPLTFMVRKSIGRVHHSVGHHSEEVDSISAARSNAASFQNFLFLATSIVRFARRESFPSPTSILRSRMNSVAIDAIDAGKY